MTMRGAQPLLDQVLKGGDEELADRVRAALKLPQTLRRRANPAQQTSDEAKTLAEKSLKAGYLKDALKYLTIAHENDPVDFAVMLKLGWVYNILHDDSDAIKWFNLARKSPDRAVSAEAGQAYHNLAPAFARFAPPSGCFRSFPPAGTTLRLRPGEDRNQARQISDPPLYFNAIHRRHARDKRLDAEQPGSAISFRNIFHLRRRRVSTLWHGVMGGLKPVKR